MSFPRAVSLSVLTLGFFALNAQALDLDWQGQFQAETNTIFGFTHDAASGGGYTVPNKGDSPANFQNLFFKLKPRVLVNDNVSIHSDIWFNTPDSGWFGSNTISGTAGTTGATFHNTGASTGAIRAQAFFAELSTDFGTLKVGRIPLQYGLGVVWNSEAGRKSRLPSNGDAITLTTKFGAFKVTPSFVKYQQSSNASSANAGITDYTLALSYNNDDEQLDLGVLFMRRLASQNSDVLNPFSLNGSYSGYAYNIWDFYAKKKTGIFTVAAEIPLSSGLVDSKNYSTVAGALKASAAVTDHWTLKANAGTASGQANGASSKLTAFYFHPDYRPGLLMFNYNYANIAAGSGSPYDNAITNARFFAFSGEYVTGKFSHEVLGMVGFADQSADGVNQYFNTQKGHYESAAIGGAAAQDKGLGFEMDYSLGYDWDEYTRFGADVGLLFPGAYYNFSNATALNTHKTVFGTNLSMTVKF